MTALTGIILFALVALAGWAIAEIKYRSISFTHSEEEQTAQANLNAQQKGYEEKNIRDILKTSTFKGFNAVG